MFNLSAASTANCNFRPYNILQRIHYSVNLLGSCCSWGYQLQLDKTCRMEWNILNQFHYFNSRI